MFIFLKNKKYFTPHPPPLASTSPTRGEALNSLYFRRHYCGLSRRSRQVTGFTLLEILIALFIFTIVSMMLMRALHHVIVTQEVTEQNAQRLHELQLTLLILSRDIEQAIDRPVKDAQNQEQPSFMGDSHTMMFTHMGIASIASSENKSTLERSGFVLQNHCLYKTTMPVLDAAPDTKSHDRCLIKHVRDGSFQYLDQTGKWFTEWPLPNQSTQKNSLPRAVELTLNLAHWGTIKQLYVITSNDHYNEQKKQ